MALVRFTTFTEIEYNTETGQSRIIRHFSSPAGKGSKAPKKETKELETGQVTMLDL